jgi:rod shape-determining protein MreC
MEHAPPPFFKPGPAPLTRLAFFSLLSLALLVLDARYHTAEVLRRSLTTLAEPLQVLALLPGAVAGRVAGFFSSQSRLREENAVLRRRVVEASAQLQELRAALAERERADRTAAMARHRGLRGLPAEIVSSARDPYARKVIVDRGAQQGVQAGAPVVDETGVIGQVTRAHPNVSEVTLLTDKDAAVPVQVVRNGLRAIAFGGGVSGLLELRFVPSSAEIEAGDHLVTSGLDGLYPAGLAVATVARVERDAAAPFARILCRPAGGVERGRSVLILEPAPQPAAPKPEEAAPARGPRAAALRRARSQSADGA